MRIDAPTVHPAGDRRSGDPGAALRRRPLQLQGSPLGAVRSAGGIAR